jgi:hypothetical protein
LSFPNSLRVANDKVSHEGGFLCFGVRLTVSFQNLGFDAFKDNAILNRMSSLNNREPNDTSLT